MLTKVVTRILALMAPLLATVHAEHEQVMRVAAPAMDECDRHLPSTSTDVLTWCSQRPFA